MRRKDRTFLDIVFIIILSVFPFWEVLSAQVNFYFGVSDYLIGLFKYGLVVLVVCVAGLLLFIKTFIFYDHYSLLVVYLIVVFIHFFMPVHHVLLFDAFRYEFLVPLSVLFYFMARGQRAISFPTFFVIITAQGVIILFFAFYEFYDQSVLEVLFRKNLYEIPHTSWHSLIRIQSLVGNPINLGASIIVWGLVLLYWLNQKDLKYFRIFFPFLVLALSVICVMTLSRMAISILFFSIVLMILFGFRRKFDRIYFILILSSFSVFVVGFLVDRFGSEYFLLRFSGGGQGVINIQDTRYGNWVSAFSMFEFWHVFWGVGAGSSTPTRDYVEAFGGVMIENGFLSVLFNYGVLGLLIYIGFYLRMFYLGVKSFPLNFSISVFIVLFVFVHAAFNLTNDFQRNLPYSMWFWFVYMAAESGFRSGKFGDA